MTVFKKTIFGKILTGAAKVALPVVGAITGIGAIGGIVKGVGALKGIGGILATGKKVIDKVGVSAINLVTGTTQPERKQVQAQKTLTKAASDAWQQVERLIQAGATPESARATVGVEESVIADYGGVEVKKDNKILIYAGLGLVALFLLPKLLKGRR